MNTIDKKNLRDRYQCLNIGPRWIRRDLVSPTHRHVETTTIPDTVLPSTSLMPTLAQSRQPASLTTNRILPDALPLDSQAQQIDVTQYGWAALEESVASCQRCPLASTRKHTVFGAGDKEARLMIVGEAPGAEEDKQGKPFVGQAGKLLDNMLMSIQLTRQHGVFITNVLKCRPPQNRNPRLDEVTCCSPYLMRQITLVQPDVILAVGRYAVNSLLQTEAPISSLRGRLHQYADIPVIVTYHPAYLLRNLPDKWKTWQDLLLVKKVLVSQLDSHDSP